MNEREHEHRLYDELISSLQLGGAADVSRLINEYNAAIAATNAKEVENESEAT